MDNKNNDAFTYTYSAKEQEELRRIREKYTHNEENKMDRLRRLDKGVTQKAQITSIVFGIISVLILGFGMSLVMSDLGEILGAYRNLAMPIGIIIGVIGGILTTLSYPVYHAIIKRERRKIAAEIIRLTDELMK